MWRGHRKKPMSSITFNCFLHENFDTILEAINQFAFPCKKIRSNGTHLQRFTINVPTVDVRWKSLYVKFFTFVLY